MKKHTFYRLHRTYEAGTSAGYEYFWGKGTAEKAMRQWLDRDYELEHDAEIEVIEVEPTKAGIMFALNKYANHADNG